MQKTIVSVESNKIEVSSDFVFKTDLAEMPGARWDKQKKVWTYPATIAAARNLLDRFGDAGMEYDEAFGVLIQQVAASLLSQGHKTAADLPPVPVTKYPAWRHQLQAYHFAMGQAGVMLAMDMGTGKTKVATDLIVNRNHQKVLVMCPKSAIEDVWVKQIPQHAGKDIHVVGFVNDMTVANKTRHAAEQMRMAKAKGKPFALVINYDSAWREPFSTWALSAGFDLVICDESHKIKSPSGKASQFAAKVGRKAMNRIAMTGTPMPHSPLDVYAQYRFVDPAIYGTSFVAFRSKYARMGGYAGKQVLGFQNETELNEKFYSVAFRVGKEILDLPPYQHITRTCKLSSKSLAAYKEVEDELCTFIGDGDVEGFVENVMTGKGAVTADNSLTNLLRLQQIANGFVVDDEKNVIELGGEKEELLAETMDALQVNEPLVVFARFRHDLDVIRRVSEKQGRKYAELSGKSNGLQEWKAGHYDVIGVQIQSGGAGIDLTRARYAIYYSIGYSMGDYDQSLARIHRPGQEHPTTFIHLITAKTVDEHVYKALDKRRTQVTKAMTERMTGNDEAEIEGATATAERVD
jgi:superfamily II DNA or RNA helicase